MEGYLLLTALPCLWLLCACLQPLAADVADVADFSNMTRRQMLNHLLNNSAMDPRIPPDYDKDVPTNVTLQMHIVSFHSVDEVSMDFTMTFYLRRKWVDERLAFQSFGGSGVLELDTRLIDHLWIPDIFFRNEKAAVVHNVTVPNRLIHLFRNGTVLFSSRLSMTLSCPMDLLLFPLDVQACPVIIQSYAYSTSNVVFRWIEGNSISKSPDWEMAHFMDHGVQTSSCSHVFDHEFACVMAIFRLQRHLGYFLVHVYLPTVLVVILSWVSFWIDVGATPARVTIGVMSVLTMATQSSSVQAVLPRVSYVKAIDVWMAVCMTFVFAALLEYAYVNVLNRHKMQDQAFRKRAQAAGSDAGQGAASAEPDDASRSPKKKKKKLPNPDPRKVDKVSRWLFPGLFTLFTVTYCTVYGLLYRFQATHRSTPV
ncbi:glycine receptor subunit alpha-1-like [Babylonia areolata]|uniref:glycine receptor subunit alpha-1-like n=1 Tax=Babylonia areolata TaxID=304850 RepID=UPI003FD1B0CC